VLCCAVGMYVYKWESADINKQSSIDSAISRNAHTFVQTVVHLYRWALRSLNYGHVEKVFVGILLWACVDGVTLQASLFGVLQAVL